MSFLIASLCWLLIMSWTYRVVYRLWKEQRLERSAASVLSTIGVASLPLLFHLTELTLEGKAAVDIAATLVATTAMLVGGLFTALFFVRS